jgi:hypothetical protein
MILGGTVIISLGLGAVSGYFFAKKKLENQYLEISNKEIAEAKQFYNALHKRDEYDTPESAVESLGLNAVKAVLDYQGKPRVVEDLTIEAVSIDAEVDPSKGPIEVTGEVNIFKDDGDGDPLAEFDYPEEIKNRTEYAPYVISHDEFMESEPGYQQVTITFFEGDDVLSDERDQVIEDIEETVGVENLKQFGHGSKDPKIVYIRNDRLELDFEVVQSQNKYVEEVLGFVQHSDQRKIRKFRGGNE